MRQGIIEIGLLVMVMGGVLVTALGDSTGALQCHQHALSVRLELGVIQQALADFHGEHGRYPTEAEGLDAVAGWFDDDRVPRDYWRRAFHYTVEGDSYAVWSMGRDGKPGGSGEDTDIYPD